MNDVDIDILLVEDSQDDIDLTLHSLRRENLANQIFVVRDGEEALDFLFCTGPYAGRNLERLPRLVLLDLKLPKVDGMEVLRRVRARRPDQTTSRRDYDVLQRGARCSQ